MGTHLLGWVVPLGARVVSICLLGSLGVAKCTTRAGPQGWAGGEVTQVSARQCEPGEQKAVLSARSRWDGSLGRQRWPELGSSASPCSSRRTAPPRRGGLCRRRRLLGAGDVPAGEGPGATFLGGTRRAVWQHFPYTVRDSGPLCPRGPHAGLGTKIHWNSLNARGGLCGEKLCCPSVEGRGLRGAGGLALGPRSPWWGAGSPWRALPGPLLSHLAPQARTPLLAGGHEGVWPRRHRPQCDSDPEGSARAFLGSPPR